MAADPEPPAADAGDEGDAAPEQVQVETLHGVPVTVHRGQTVLHPSRDEYLDLVRRLRDAGWWVCVDVCAVDYLHAEEARELPAGVAPERFEVVVNLLNHRERSRLRLRVQVDADDPVVPSIVPLHPGVENHERETYDLFGIRFEGHPDLTRILLPDDWEGHPLRKDYAVGRIPVQFKGAPSAR